MCMFVQMSSDEEEFLEADGHSGGFDAAYFDTSNYTPRPSKRRGKARHVQPVQKLTYLPHEPKHRSPSKARKAKKGMKVAFRLLRRRE